MTKRTPSICECGEHGFVACTMGSTTLFSPSDLGLVAKHAWSISRPGGKLARRRYAHCGGGATANCHPRQPLHREIAKATKGSQVDHIDGDTLNNRRENLRLCTNSQNQMSKHRTGRAGKFRGVHETVHGWMATITKDNVQRFLGYHDTAVQAALVYDAAARELFGQFARPNFEHRSVV